MKKPPILKEELESYIIKGMSTYDISKKVNRGQTTVIWWLKKYGLKTNHRRGEPQNIINYNVKSTVFQKI